MNARAGARPLRRLVVLRHAKSAWPEGVPDHQRPLAPRGRRDAPAAGIALAETDSLPDLALCSTAVRARQTWELASAEWGTPPPVRYEPSLYAADVPELLDAVHQVPPEVETLLLIGHNPGLEDLVLELMRRQPRRRARRGPREVPDLGDRGPGLARQHLAGPRPGHGPADGRDRT